MKRTLLALSTLAATAANPLHDRRIGRPRHRRGSGKRLIVQCCGLLAIALPASALTSAPSLRTEEVFFRCNGVTKVANVNTLLYLYGTVPGWNTSRPTQSMQQGGGCGWADPSANPSTPSNPDGSSLHDATWRGTFTGNLETLTVGLHSITMGPSRVYMGSRQTFNVSLFVDGTSMFGLADDGRANRATVRLVPVMSSGHTSALYRFSITGLPFRADDGDGTKKRAITLSVAAASEHMMTWVYGATEVPSGIIFNPTEPAPVSVVAKP